MKKHFRLICTMCLAGTLAFFASSCKKNQEEQAVKVILPEFVDDGTEFSDDGSKAYINLGIDGRFRWNANDEIMVYNVDNKGESNEKAVYATDDDSEGAYEASFSYQTGTRIGAKKDHYFIFYPTTKIENPDASTLPAGNVEYFLVEDEQDYTLTNMLRPTVDPSSMALATEVNSLSDAFTLHHIFGIMRLRLKAAVNGVVVDKIVVKDNYRHMTGRVWMKLHKVNMTTFSDLIDASLYTWANVSNPASEYYTQWNAYRTELGYGAESDSYEVTLNCRSDDTYNLDENGGYGVPVSKNNFTPFYISLRPGALIGGFDVDVYYHTQGGEPESKKAEIRSWSEPNTTGSGYAIKPGVVLGFKYSTLLQ